MKKQDVLERRATLRPQDFAQGQQFDSDRIFLQGRE
jgi:hypothetical protein